MQSTPRAKGERCGCGRRRAGAGATPRNRACASLWPITAGGCRDWHRPVDDQEPDREAGRDHALSQPPRRECRHGDELLSAADLGGVRGASGGVLRLICAEFVAVADSVTVVGLCLLPVCNRRWRYSTTGWWPQSKRLVAT